MSKKTLKEEEDNLLDDLNKIDNENKDDGDSPSDPPENKDDEKDDDNSDDSSDDVQQKNIVDMMVGGDLDGVKSAIHKHVVSTVAKNVNNINKEPEDSSSDDDNKDDSESSDDGDAE